MQHIILAFALLLTTSLASIGQCDKNVKWHASKVEMLDAGGNVQDSKTGTILVTTNRQKLILEIAEDPNDKLEGQIDSTECEWKEAFKNGKTVWKSSLVRMDGNSMPATLTIEGKDGKFVGLLELQRGEETRWFRLLLDKYELSE